MTLLFFTDLDRYGVPNEDGETQPLHGRFYDSDGSPVDASDVALAFGKENRPKSAATRQDCLVFLDARSIKQDQASVPARNEKQALAAAPFLVEDALATGLDSIHLTLGGSTKEPQRRVTAVDDLRFGTLLACLSSHGLDVRAVYPETDLLIPGAPPVMIQTADGDRILGRSEAGVGYGLDVEMADLLPVLAGTRADDQVRASTDADTLPAVLEEAKLVTSAAINRLKGSGDNLLTGRHMVRRQAGPGLLGNRLLVGLLSISLLAFLLSIMISIQATDSRADQFDREGNLLMKEAFPKARNLAHMRQIVAGMNAADGDPFLAMAAATFKVVEANENVRLSRLRFNAERGTMDVTLDAPSFADLQSLRSAYSATGLNVSEGASRQASGRVETDLTLSR